MSLTDELCRSYLDLCWHWDPALGTQEGIREADSRLGRFDRVTVREHLAAFGALAGAVEELGVEDAADEIDRTALLDEIRVATFRLEHEQPHVRNPAFWMLHLCEALHALHVRPGPDEAVAPAAAARVRSIPEFLIAAADTLQNPPSVFVDIALSLTEGCATLLTETLARFRVDAPDLPRSRRRRSRV